MPDFTSILVPVVVAVVLSVSGALAVARYSGPAQTAYIQALQGRMSLVERERDEAISDIPRLEARIHALEDRVRELQEANVEKDREIARLYRRLDEDEKRIGK